MVTRRSFLAGLTLAAAIVLPSLAAERSIIVASTTSTENSGLFTYILPIFETASGIRVKVVAVGTGQAIVLAQNGDADVLLVHHKLSEEKFVAEGYGVKRSHFCNIIKVHAGQDITKQPPFLLTNILMLAIIMFIGFHNSHPGKTHFIKGPVMPAPAETIKPVYHHDIKIW